MLCIENTCTNPYLNLAAEEYLLKYFDEPIFMLWRNESAIIVGKYQNTQAEINVDFVKENGIKVVRRITGGGAVFHDLGNLNYTFIAPAGKDNFQTFSQPILDVLHSLGVPARFEGRNDLTINGLKFSGNAQCVFRNRILHHGTLLFDSKMTDLSAALRVNPLKFQDKAVKSVRKRVTNISEHLMQSIAITDFSNLIMNHIRNHYPNSRIYEWTLSDREKFREISTSKYETWEWNFGTSPQSNFTQTIRTKGGNIQVNLLIESGFIRDMKLYGDFFAKQDLTDLEQKFMGRPYTSERVAEVLRQVRVEDYLLQVTNEDMERLLGFKQSE